MKTLIWKIRFTARFYWLTHMSPRYGWDAAGAWITDTLNGDITDASPADCVADEIEAGLQG